MSSNGPPDPRHFSYTDSALSASDAAAFAEFDLDPSFLASLGAAPQPQSQPPHFGQPQHGFGFNPQANFQHQPFNHSPSPGAFGHSPAPASPFQQQQAGGFPPQRQPQPHQQQHFSPQPPVQQHGFQVPPQQQGYASPLPRHLQQQQQFPNFQGQQPQQQQFQQLTQAQVQPQVAHLNPSALASANTFQQAPPQPQLGRPPVDRSHHLPPTFSDSDEDEKKPPASAPAVPAPDAPATTQKRGGSLKLKLKLKKGGSAASPVTTAAPVAAADIKGAMPATRRSLGDGDGDAEAQTGRGMRARGSRPNYTETGRLPDEDDVSGAERPRRQSTPSRGGYGGGGTARRRSSVMRVRMADEEVISSSGGGDVGEDSQISTRRSSRSARSPAGGRGEAGPAGRKGKSFAISSSPDPLDSMNHGNDEDAHGDEDAEGDDDGDEDAKPVRTTRSGRSVGIRSYAENGDDDDDDDEDEIKPRRRPGTSALVSDFVAADDDEEEDPDAEFGASRKRKSGRLVRGASSGNKVAALAKKRSGGAKRRKGGFGDRLPSDYEDDGEEETPDEGSDGEGSDGPEGSQGKSYRLRERKKVNYSLVPPPAEPQRDGFGRVIRSNRGSKSGGRSGNAFELDGLGTLTGLPVRTKKGKEGWDALPTSMSGKDYARVFGDEPDSSDDDIPAQRKAGAGAGPAVLGGAAGGLLGAGGNAVAGGGSMGPDLGSNRDAVGRMKGTDAMADVDPLGVNMAIDFDSVGGLDGHVQQLKEMVSLPLLYPELFQQFKVTPPRGVLFHGPPGTGKTLVARALAASCSTSGQQISFFMRKGADCLSKWVGEAERQLRLLFEEARNSQPSIIFFDEIDGLAPVRSSKQDQIHASIVSTLLALMDGMDGRGQVVVIGATNRPDSVDPALRRPGRFDREFYFPLPNREARRAIIEIHTKGWEPPLAPEFKEKLSEVTKGYGGADLRALCTEAALNAIQRRYPQIYSTTERLLLKPETIKVEAKDFMMSVAKVVPSSARSSSSAAAPVPEHLRPLLQSSVDKAVAALNKVLPPASKRNPLEEALWEDDEPLPGLTDGDAGFGREMMLQSFERLRVFRPRLLIHGELGMGQAAVGAALLHHLEGYHVQTLDVASLLGDSTRTPEASVVQLFVEAKRHKPSVIFIPGLVHWANSVTESVRGTTKALLEGLAASDPVLLVAIAEDSLDYLPRDVRSWFGYLQENRVSITAPSTEQRREYFGELVKHIERPPNAFPDGLPRRKRVLEKLPIAPPRPKREPTAAELAQQEADDQRLLEHLKYRLGPVLSELRKKYKQFCRDVAIEYNLDELCAKFESSREKGKVIVKILYDPFISARMRRDSSAQAEGQHLRELVDSALSSSQVPPDASQDAAGDAKMQDGTTTEANGILTNGHTTDDAAGAPPSSQPPAAAPSGPRRPTPPPGLTWDESGDYWTRDLEIYTLNLEKMQKKLYHNGYLTTADFLSDVGKLVCNAEAAREVDENRMVRAHQMRNLANILVDQYIDAPFQAECERMAARILAREAKKRAEEIKAREAATAAASAAPTLPPKPAGERSSARVQGKEPEIKGNPDVLSIERKRSRTSSSHHAAGTPGHAEDQAHKRARTQVAMEVDEQVAAGGAVASSTVASGSAQAQQQLQAVPGAADQPADDVATTPKAPSVPDGTATSVALNGAHAVPSEAAEAEAASSEPAAPPVVHPPFTLDTSAVASLAAHLVEASASFNVEQLEQLRAACFSAVWKHRSSWDREELLVELRGLVDQVAEAVREEKKALEDEDGEMRA